MKRIAIFCDGTWNRADAEHGTNVVKLSQAMSFIDDNGVFQQMSYIQGVGTGRGTGWFSRIFDRVGGGIFGWGLNATIEEAYRGLAFSYQPGDEIYIFGFSRGAFTARSLAGLIRSSGIPPRTRINKVPDALKRYQSGNANTKPNDVESFQFRLEMNSDIVTSPAEAAWRAENGHPTGHMLNIAYVGVWDTVVALGVPKHFKFLASIFNGKYAFHDAALSRSVRAARHAVAIDERRRTFPAATWDNLDFLNGETTGDESPYHQLWFPGVHGSVGGGGDIVGLSDATLVWIAEGAQTQGLQFEQDVLDWHRGSSNPMAPLSNQTEPKGWMGKLLARFSKNRSGPTEPDAVSDVTIERWRTDSTYRPETLDNVKDHLNAD